MDGCMNKLVRIPGQAGPNLNVNRSREPLAPICWTRPACLAWQTWPVGCGLICQYGNLIMAIAFFTVNRVYKWEFNSRKEIKAILPTGDGSFLNPLIYYMNIAKKRLQNPCFWENCLFGVKKCILPKNKSCSKNFELL